MELTFEDKKFILQDKDIILLNTWFVTQDKAESGAILQTIFPNDIYDCKTCSKECETCGFKRDKSIKTYLEGRKNMMMSTNKYTEMCLKNNYDMLLGDFRLENENYFYPTEKSYYYKISYTDCDYHQWGDDCSCLLDLRLICFYGDDKDYHSIFLFKCE
jgi:hypothetical protein